MKRIEKWLAKLGYFKFTTKQLLSPEYMDYHVASIKCQWLNRYNTTNNIGITLLKENKMMISIHNVPDKNGSPDIKKIAIQKLSKGTVFMMHGTEYKLTEDISLVDFSSENIFPITSSGGEFLYYDIHITTKNFISE